MKKLIYMILLIIAGAGIYFLVTGPGKPAVDSVLFLGERERYIDFYTKFENVEKKKIQISPQGGPLPYRTGSVLLLTVGAAGLSLKVHSQYYKLPPDIRPSSLKKAETVIFVSAEMIKDFGQMSVTYLALRMYSFDTASFKFLGAYEIGRWRCDAMGNSDLGGRYPDLVSLIKKMPVIHRKSTTGTQKG